MIDPHTGHERNRPNRRPDAAGTFHRSALKLFTMSSAKNAKGEKRGYLQATLYLQPHTAGGGRTLCPHSTEACRAMCLAGAGLSGLPVQLRAKQRRTDFYLGDPEGFARVLRQDIDKLARIAAYEGLKPCVRLNGTSDILWEREAPSLFASFPTMTFFDYTKVPIERRLDAPANYHLTYSIEGPDSMVNAIRYLRAGLSVAAVVPEHVKDDSLGRWIAIDGRYCYFVDGDADDLRFLDPPGSIVLLRPKGHVRTSLMREHLLSELLSARCAS